MTDRIQTFEQFWPFYLSEHRDARSRRLHFLGTSGWLAAVAGSALVNPVGFGAAMTAFAAALVHGVKAGEGQAPRLANIGLMVALPTIASPLLFPAGVVWAYGCAWTGHFGFEKNRPASFKYPLWSFAADLRLYSEMCLGKHWMATEAAA